MEFRANLSREDFKKNKRQRKWHCAKRGGVSEKYQIMNVLLKSDILLGEGGWSKPMSFFQNVFLLIICQFFSSSCYILSSIFSIIASFFPIFDTNSHFIIDCCVNGKVWVKEICKKVPLMWNGFGRCRIYTCYKF